MVGMGTIYFDDRSLSLDGFIAGPNVSAELPLGEVGERLHDWMFAGKSEQESREFEEKIFQAAGAMNDLDSAQRWFANTSVVDSEGVVHLCYRLLRQ
jgi:hypothetical protein